MSSRPDPFAGKYSVQPNGCWVWQRAIQSRGYGSVWRQGRSHLAHRLSYQLSVGAIPAGYDVHHTCRNRRCVNPAHLELQRHPEHSALAENPLTRNIHKTHCKRGHALAGANLVVDSRGRRQCRTCINDRQRARRAARAAIRKAAQEALYES
ncbi:MAG: HNH endonuclease [Anaerolineales bacterium]|nr:HNH endonuclease [Anaerolineales bacterium]